MFQDHYSKKYWQRVFGVGIVLLQIFLFGSQRVNAKTNDCFLVQSAGNEAVNGLYRQIGAHNQKPAYKHASAEYYVSFDALGYGSEWNLTTAVGGGLDLYFIQSDQQSVPETGWLHGLRGLYPGMVISWDVCQEAGNESQIFDLTWGQTLEGAFGKQGIFTPESFTSGHVVITKLPARELPLAQNLHLYGKGMRVDFYNQDGASYKTFQGLNYLFFNLDRQTRKLWWSGELQIFHFEANRGWQAVPGFWVRSRWPGRIATLITSPGIFVLGTQK